MRLFKRFHNSGFCLITVRAPALSGFVRASYKISEPIFVFWVGGVSAEFSKELVEMFRIRDYSLWKIFALLHLFNIKSSQIII